MTTTTKVLLLGPLFLFGVFPALGQETGQWELSSGFNYSSGDYGGDPFDTEVTSIPFTTTYTRGLWQFDATLPYVSIDGAGTVVPGEGVIRNRRGPGGPGPTPQLISGSESGLGDISLGGSYFIDTIPDDPFFLELGGGVKLPTADEDKGLGTGATDFTLQADFYIPAGTATPFATVGYKFKGDAGDLELDNVPFYSIGSDFAISQDANVGLSLDYQEAYYPTGDDFTELMGYYSRDLSNSWSLTIYAFQGLADGSPDHGAGLSLSYAL